MKPLHVLLRDALQRETDLRSKVGRLELAAEADPSLEPELEAATTAWSHAISTSRRREERAALARRVAGRAA